MERWNLLQHKVQIQMEMHANSQIAFGKFEKDFLENEECSMVKSIKTFDYENYD